MGCVAEGEVGLAWGVGKPPRSEGSGPRNRRESKLSLLRFVHLRRYKQTNIAHAKDYCWKTASGSKPR